MILDNSWRFSTEQAITGTVVSTNAVDITTIPSDPGNGEPLYVDIHITEAFTTGTSAAIVFNVALCVASGSFSALTDTFIGSSVSYAPSPAVLPAQLTLNSHILVPIMPFSSTQAAEQPTLVAATIPRRYIQMVYQELTGGGASFTAGKVTATLTAAPRSMLMVSRFADAQN